jgi:hypothetical protein
MGNGLKRIALWGPFLFCGLRLDSFDQIASKKNQIAEQKRSKG